MVGNMEIGFNDQCYRRNAIWNRLPYNWLRAGFDNSCRFYEWNYKTVHRDAFGHRLSQIMEGSPRNAVS
jgi:hypothetical protein